MPGNKKPRKKYNPHKAQQTLIRRQQHRYELAVERAQMAEIIKNFSSFSLDERMKLKYPPHDALMHLAKGPGTEDHWFTVLVRVFVGLEVAVRLDYTNEVIQSFQDVIQLLLELRERMLSSHAQVWRVTTEECEQISSCLEATDALQDVVENEKRLDVLWSAFKKTDEHVKPFVPHNLKKTSAS
jgi:hypothetical protein